MIILGIVYVICWVASILVGIFVFVSMKIDKEEFSISDRVMHIIYVLSIACLLSPITGILTFLIVLELVHIKQLDKYLK